MEMENLKIGRISRKIQRAIGKEYESYPSVYLPEKALRGLTDKYPDRYLKAIEMVKETVKEPDFAGLTGEEIVLIRGFKTARGLRFWAVSVSEKDFAYRSFREFSDREMADLVEKGGTLARV